MTQKQHKIYRLEKQIKNLEEQMKQKSTPASSWSVYNPLIIVIFTVLGSYLGQVLASNTDKEVAHIAADSQEYQVNKETESQEYLEQRNTYKTIQLEQRKFNYGILKDAINYYQGKPDKLNIWLRHLLKSGIIDKKLVSNEFFEDQENIPELKELNHIVSQLAERVNYIERSESNNLLDTQGSYLPSISDERSGKIDLSVLHYTSVDGEQINIADGYQKSVSLYDILFDKKDSNFITYGSVKRVNIGTEDVDLGSLIGSQNKNDTYYDVVDISKFIRSTEYPTIPIKSITNIDSDIIYSNKLDSIILNIPIDVEASNLDF